MIGLDTRDLSKICWDSQSTYVTSKKSIVHWELAWAWAIVCVIELLEKRTEKTFRNIFFSFNCEVCKFFTFSWKPFCSCQETSFLALIKMEWNGSGTKRFFFFLSVTFRLIKRKVLKRHGKKKNWFGFNFAVQQAGLAAELAFGNYQLKRGLLAIERKCPFQEQEWNWFPKMLGKKCLTTYGSPLISPSTHLNPNDPCNGKKGIYYRLPIRNSMVTLIPVEKQRGLIKSRIFIEKLV